MTNFASREWLLGHLADMKIEAARMRKNATADAAAKFNAKRARKKPWPRKPGITTASGGQALFRQ